MNRTGYRNILWATAAAIAATVALTQPALSQGPPGMPQMSPAAQAKMKAWRKFRDSHKNVSAVQRTVRGLGELDKDPKTKLTPAQAKSILAVLTAWRKKPVMTNDQALAVNKKLTASLTLAQIKKMATMRDERGGPGGGRRGGPGGGGPGGSGSGRQGGAGFGGGRPGGGGWDPSKMPAPKEYNPLNPDTIPMERMRDMAKKRIDGLIASLKARAAAKA